VSKPFWDNHQFLHDTANASSGNPLIYSAFWKCLTGEQIDYKDTYFKYMVKHPVMGNDLSIKRTPTNNEAASLDEIIGAISLDLIDDDFLKLYNYRWHDTLYSPKWYRVLQAGIYCLGKHRNFFKTADVRDMHVIAYLVPPHIRHYMHKKAGKRVHITCIMFYLWLFSVLIKKNYKKGEKQTTAISQKNICYLILSDLNSLHWIKLFNHKKNFTEYFDNPNHPICLHLQNN